MKMKFYLIVLSLLAVCLWGTGDVRAQSASRSMTVTGKVVDQNGAAVTGASVVVVGTTKGTTTGADGAFSLTGVASDARLAVNFIGYKTQTVEVGGRTSFNIVLVEEATAVDEVVVVGYGQVKKSDLTGSVASVKAEKLTDIPANSIDGLLQGRVAGVQVVNSSQDPGASSTVRIRGNSSLNGSNAPLVVIDGFPWGDAGDLKQINPQDIVSMEVLKDASASAIYGSRGANGVILITTKTAKEGRFNIEYTGMVAYQEPEHYFDVISNYADYMEIMNESAWNVGKANVFSQTMIDLWREKEKTPNGIADSGYPNYVAYPNVDWMEAIFTPSVYQKHSISASGSTERIKYLMSVSYMDNPGVIDNSTVTRTSYRFNLSSDVTEWLEVGARIYGYRSDTELADISGSMTLLSRGVPCIYPYYDGKYGWMENPEQSSESRNNLYFFNRYKGSNITHYNNTTAFVNVKLPWNIR